MNPINGSLSTRFKFFFHHIERPHGSQIEKQQWSPETHNPLIQTNPKLLTIWTETRNENQSGTLKGWYVIKLAEINTKMIKKKQRKGLVSPNLWMRTKTNRAVIVVYGSPVDGVTSFPIFGDGDCDGDAVGSGIAAVLSEAGIPVGSRTLSLGGAWQAEVMVAGEWFLIFPSSSDFLFPPIFFLFFSYVFPLFSSHSFLKPLSWSAVGASGWRLIRPYTWSEFEPGEWLFPLPLVVGHMWSGPL